MTEPPVEHLDVQGIVVHTDQALAVEQQLREIADPAARFQHPLAEIAAEPFGAPPVAAAPPAHALLLIIAAVGSEARVDEAIFEQPPARRPGIRPSGLFAFGAGAAAITDRPLIQAPVP